MIQTDYPHGPDFPIISVETELCSARISLYGGQVLSWKPRSQEHDVFYMSPNCQFEQGRALRGGVPLCWPWFGKHPEDATAPSHGVARISLWQLAKSELDEAGVMHILLALPATDEHMPSAALVLELGEELVMSLLTLDVPAQMPFSAAQHSYYAVSDYETIAITGLEESPFVEYAASPTEHMEDPLIPAGNIDRIYCPVDEKAQLCIHDPAWNRTISILRDGSGSSIVWNPGEELAAGMSDLGAEQCHGFIALETSAVPAEGLSLRYGETHRLTTRVTVVTID